MITLETAYSWINKFDGAIWLYEIGSRKTYLEPASRQLLRQLYLALSKGKSQEVWKIKNKVMELCHQLSRFDPGEERQKAMVMEEAETCIECALVIYKLGCFSDAVDLLDKALGRYLSRFNHEHNAGIIYWMKGYILWQTATKHNDAIVAWRNAIDEFYKAKVNADANNKNWYDNQINKMNNSICEAIDKDSI